MYNLKPVSSEKVFQCSFFTITNNNTVLMFCLFGDTLSFMMFSSAEHLLPGAPLTYFNDRGGLSDFFGSEILAKSDFFGSMKDAGIFGGCKEKQWDFFRLQKNN